MENEETVIHDFDLNLICDYFGRLERQGPGSPESTIRALSFIDNFSNELKIADLACGTGGQTMILAQNTKGTITGLDISGIYVFVDERGDIYYPAPAYTETRVKLDPYHRFDMNIRYAINEMFTITARGENLNNADYMETYGYNTKEKSFYGGLELVL